MKNDYIKSSRIFISYLNHSFEFIKIKSFLFIHNIYEFLAPFRFLIIKLPFLSQKFTLTLLIKSDIPKLINYNFHSFKYFKSLNELAIKYLDFTSDHRDIVNCLTMSAWCIAFSNNKKSLLDKFLICLNSSHLSDSQLYKLSFELPNPFFIYGDMSNAEKLHLSIKNLYDKRLSLKPSIFNETKHFSAIGHLTLTFFLLQAIHSGLIDPKKNPISLVFDPNEIANFEYASLIRKLCDRYDVKIVMPRKGLLTEFNLELWPINHKKQYIIARHYHFSVYQKSISGVNPFLLKPLEKQIEVGELILSKYFDLNDFDFIGMHFRTVNDSKNLRNPNLSSFQLAIDLIRSRGKNVLLVGNNSNNKYSKLKSCFDTTKLNLTRYQSECLNIYIWSKSLFFVGSLSGGTMPPMTFGTPTIWLDIHPTIHYRPPNLSDIYLPKRIYCKNLNRYITFEESHSDEHIASQTESPSVALSKGYEMHGAKRELIEKAIIDMLNKSNTDSHENIKINHPDPEKYDPFLDGAKIYT